MGQPQPERWRTSSYSNKTNCVEVAWRTSTYCEQETCVEVATGSRVLVRDSKDPGPVLAFTREQWAAFTMALKG